MSEGIIAFDINGKIDLINPSAKMLLKISPEDYTFEGVLHKAKEISYQKKFVRLVNEGLKRYKEAEKEKEKQERLKQEQKEKNINKQKKKKTCAAKRKEKQLNEIIDISLFDQLLNYLIGSYLLYH